MVSHSVLGPRQGAWLGRRMALGPGSDANQREQSSGKETPTQVLRWSWGQVEVISSGGQCCLARNQRSHDYHYGLRSRSQTQKDLYFTLWGERATEEEVACRKDNTQIRTRQEDMLDPAGSGAQCGTG